MEGWVGLSTMIIMYLFACHAMDDMQCSNGLYWTRNPQANHSRSDNPLPTVRYCPLVRYCIIKCNCVYLFAACTVDCDIQCMRSSGACTDTSTAEVQRRRSQSLAELDSIDRHSRTCRRLSCSVPLVPRDNCLQRTRPCVSTVPGVSTSSIGSHSKCDDGLDRDCGVYGITRPHHSKLL